MSDWNSAACVARIIRMNLCKLVSNCPNGKGVDNPAISPDDVFVPQENNRGSVWCHHPFELVWVGTWGQRSFS